MLRTIKKILTVSDYQASERKAVWDLFLFYFFSLFLNFNFPISSLHGNGGKSVEGKWYSFIAGHEIA